MQNAECAVKTAAVLRGGCVVWNHKLTEFVIPLLLAEGNGSGRFWLPTCAILHGMQVFNIALVQMVCYGPLVCVDIATGWNLLLSLSRSAQLTWSAMLAVFFFCLLKVFHCLFSRNFLRIWNPFLNVPNPLLSVGNLRFVSMHAYKMLM